MYLLCSLDTKFPVSTCDGDVFAFATHLRTTPWEQSSECGIIGQMKCVSFGECGRPASWSSGKNHSCKHDVVFRCFCADQNSKQTLPSLHTRTITRIILHMCGFPETTLRPHVGSICYLFKSTWLYDHCNTFSQARSTFAYQVPTNCKHVACSQSIKGNHQIRPIFSCTSSNEGGWFI